MALLASSGLPPLSLRPAAAVVSPLLFRPSSCAGTGTSPYLTRDVEQPARALLIISVFEQHDRDLS